MTYLKGRPRGPLPGAISGFDPFASIKGLLTPPPAATGAASCGAGQSYYADVVYNGIKGQCLTAQQYADCKAGRIPGCSMAVITTSAPPSSSPSLFDVLVSTLTAPAKLPTATAPAAQPQGMSSTTKVALAGGAVLLVALVASRR